LTEHSKAISEDLRAILPELLPQLRRFARSLAGNRDDGDDLMQATVERVLQKGMPADATPRAWLFTICKNLFIDGRRAHAVRAKAAQLPELAEQTGISGERVALGELTLREVDRAMGELPEEQRLVLSLVTVEGMSYREAAAVLDVPIGTVMSRLARGRSALVRFFDSETPEWATGDD
jgi:RNA polymerase sigma-70 factor (ECF subfamily)